MFLLSAIFLVWKTAVFCSFSCLQILDVNYGGVSLIAIVSMVLLAQAT